VNPEAFSNGERKTSNVDAQPPAPFLSHTQHNDISQPDTVTGMDAPTILVVEDHADLAAYIGNHLAGFGVVYARNGAEGLDRAVAEVPDLIISDVMMPEMDGIAFCSRVKADERTSHIPVILLTAKANMESRLEGLSIGADDYLIKPFDVGELQTRVQNLILQRQKLRERFSKEVVVLKPGDIGLSSPDERFLEKVMHLVEAKIDDATFGLDDFQREMGMSRMQLHRKLKALTGQAPGEFVRLQRLTRAAQMLSHGHANISEVCYATGFANLSYFAKCFKQQYGATPKEYHLSHTAASQGVRND
jgi:DNA-binding response OmpR family regulator